MVQTLAYTFDAGVVKNVKTGASPLEINDVMHSPLVSDPISPMAKRTRGKVTNVAGVTKPKIDSNLSVANRN
jgi:hypothetical protein